MPGDHQPDADEVKEMRAIQAYHMGTKKWSDIAYSFVIFDDGSIYEGRGFGIKGGHTENHNSVSHGICFAGNFERERPTIAALDACRWLIAEGIRRGFIKRGRQPTGGHRDTKPTSCPGDTLYALRGYLRKPWEDDMSPAEVQKMINEAIDKAMRADRVREFAAGIFVKYAGQETQMKQARAKGVEFAEKALLPGGVHTHEYSGETGESGS